MDNHPAFFLPSVFAPISTIEQTKRLAYWDAKINDACEIADMATDTTTAIERVKTLTAIRDKIASRPTHD